MSHQGYCDVLTVRSVAFLPCPVYWVEIAVLYTAVCHALYAGLCAALYFALAFYILPCE